MTNSLFKKFHIQLFKKPILVGFIIVLVSFGMLLISPSAKAASLWDLLKRPGQAVLVLFSWLIYAILSLVGNLVPLAASFANAFVSFTDIADAPIVKIGASAVKDIANMFYILILLIIAFATILRIETYGMKAILPYLIISALLINFSLVLATPIVNLSTAISNTFLKTMTGTDGKTNVSGEIVKAFNLSNFFYSGMEQLSEDIPDEYAPILAFMFAMIIGIVFELFAAFVLFVLGIYFLIRIGIIWVLLILSPIVWVLWILPMTKQYWSQWWEKFLHWSFFAPICLFFVFLAVTTASTLSSNFLTFKGSKVEFNMDLLMQFGFTFIFLIAGQKVAQQLGGAIAATAIGSAKKVQGAVTDRVNRFARQRLAPQIEKTLPTISKIPVARMLTKPLAQYAAGARADVMREKEKLKNLSPIALQSYLQAQTAGIGPKNLAAIAATAETLAENRSLNVKDDKVRKQIIQAALATNSIGAIKTARPDWIPETVKKQPGESSDAHRARQQQAMADYIGTMSIENASKIQKEAFDDDNFVQTFFENAKPEHLQNIVQKSPDIINHSKFQDVISKLTNLIAVPNQIFKDKLEEKNPQLVRYIIGTPAKRITQTTPSSPPSEKTKSEEQKTEERKKIAQERLQELLKKEPNKEA